MSAADETFRMLAGIIEAARLMPPVLRAAPRSLPVTVIGGFLGAGKTTLLNRLLAAPHGRRLAVLVNDFGRINVDAALVQSRTADTIALTNGCACCSIAGDLTRALVDLAQREDAPEAIVIEASGVADPRGLAQIALSNPAMRLDGVVTLVDAETVFEHADDAAYGALFRAQVEAADLAVLTKGDLVTAGHARDAREWVASHAVGSAVVESVHGDVPVDIVLGLGTGRMPAAIASNLEHAKGFRSHVMEWEEPIDEREIEARLQALGGEVLRAKGFVCLAASPQRRTLLQRVGARCEYTAGAPWNGAAPRSEVVVITKAG